MNAYEAVAVAQDIFCKKMAEEICADPLMMAEALMESFKLHPLKTALTIHSLRQSGRVDDMLAFEDLIRKSAETLADEAWRKQA